MTCFVVYLICEHTVGDGATDKIARDVASKEAIIYFEKNPPQFVQKMKDKS